MPVLRSPVNKKLRECSFECEEAHINIQYFIFYMRDIFRMLQFISCVERKRKTYVVGKHGQGLQIKTVDVIKQHSVYRLLQN